MNRVLIFHTNYLGLTRREHGYQEAGEDTPLERWHHWKQHYSQFGHDVRCFHDGAVAMGQPIYPSEIFNEYSVYNDPAIVWGAGDRIGRPALDNWAGLRYYFAQGLLWGLRHGYEIFAYIESDCYTCQQHDARIIKLLEGEGLGESDIINAIDPSAGTSLMIMGQVAACRCVDYFSKAVNVFATDREHIFENQMSRIPGTNRRFELAGYRLEGNSADSIPASSEYLTQVNTYERVKAFIGE